jgi:hypothetical protein
LNTLKRISKELLEQKEKLRRVSAFTPRVGLQRVQRPKNSLESSKFPKLRRDNIFIHAVESSSKGVRRGGRKTKSCKGMSV